VFSLVIILNGALADYRLAASNTKLGIIGILLSAIGTVHIDILLD
jgi:hypothetical protein